MESLALNAWQYVWPLLKWLASVILASGIILWAVKSYSEKWIANRFNESLEKFKHAQQKEIERIKFKIGSMTDRAIKFHNYEFEILPKLWENISISHGSVSTVVSSFQQFPDLTRMSEAQFEAFMERCALEEWQKDELRKSADRNKYYQDHTFFQHLQSASKANTDFNNHLILSSLFIEDELRELCEKLRIFFGTLIIEIQMERQFPQQQTNYEKRLNDMKECEELVKAIRAVLRQRLWNGLPTSIELD